MRFCKYCGIQLSETDFTCPNCGKEARKFASDTISEETIPVHSGTIAGKHKKYPNRFLVIAIAAAIICAVIAMVIIAAAPGRCKADGCKNKSVSGSDYCYSHKCTSSGCERERLYYSNYCRYHYLLYDDNSSDSNDKVNSDELEFSNMTLSYNSISTVAEGTLTNNSSKTVSYVKIKGAFKTSMGTVVDTDWTYAVGSEGLAPGESCKWRMSVSKDYSIEACSVTILDFDC